MERRLQRDIGASQRMYLHGDGEGGEGMSVDPLCFHLQLIVLSWLHWHGTQLNDDHERHRVNVKDARQTKSLTLAVQNTDTHTHTHLEPLWHVCRANLVILVGHVTAFQLAGFVDLEDASFPHPPLDLLLGSVPALFVLVLLLFLTLLVRVGVKVSKDKVTTEYRLGFL